MRLLAATATVASSTALLLGLGVAPAAASDDLGETTVTTASGIVRALIDEDLEVRATGEAEVEKSDGRLKVSFRITDLENGDTEISHAGGLAFVNRDDPSQRLRVSAFLVDLDEKTLSGRVNGGGYAELFTLDTSGGEVTLGLTDVAADALNDALDTDLFDEGLEFGTAKVSLDD
jgi:hypothetical protein